LALREALREAVIVPDASASDDRVLPVVFYDYVVEDEYLASVEATGPPLTDEELNALELCGELLGARPVTSAA
jgi:hypothetical protein